MFSVFLSRKTERHANRLLDSSGARGLETEQPSQKGRAAEALAGWPGSPRKQSASACCCQEQKTWSMAFQNRCPFSKIDRPGEWNQTNLNQCHLFLGKLSQKDAYAQSIVPHRLTWKCTDPCGTTTFPSAGGYLHGGLQKKMQKFPKGEGLRQHPLLGFKYLPDDGKVPGSRSKGFSQFPRRSLSVVGVPNPSGLEHPG